MAMNLKITPIYAGAAAVGYGMLGVNAYSHKMNKKTSMGLDGHVVQKSVEMTKRFGDNVPLTMGLLAMCEMTGALGALPLHVMGATLMLSKLKGVLVADTDLDTATDLGTGTLGLATLLPMLVMGLALPMHCMPKM